MYLQQLESCYFAIMMSAKINKHSNLWAYKHLEGVSKLDANDQPAIMSFNEVKALVQKDYERMNAFKFPDKFRLVKFEDNEKREAISYFDLMDPETKEFGLILPEGITTQ